MTAGACTDTVTTVEHRPDVALLDVGMPLLSGRAVLAEVVRLELATRVLVCSAHGEPAVVRALLQGGTRGSLAARPRDRRADVHQPRDRQNEPQAVLGEARRVGPHGARRDGDAARLLRSAHRRGGDAYSRFSAK